jgi:hypothetical protein
LRRRKDAAGLRETTESGVIQHSSAEHHEMPIEQIDQAALIDHFTPSSRALSSFDQLFPCDDEAGFSYSPPC